jgi:hypothetical protein
LRGWLVLARISRESCLGVTAGHVPGDDRSRTPDQAATIVAWGFRRGWADKWSGRVCGELGEMPETVDRDSVLLKLSETKA